MRGLPLREIGREIMTRKSTEKLQARARQQRMSERDPGQERASYRSALHNVRGPDAINGPLDSQPQESGGDATRPVIYAGIDEAGLGPLLGPFTLGVVAFKIQKGGDIFTNLDDLILGPIAPIAEFNPPRGSSKLLIRDSKVLFSQGGSIRRLEEAALAFAFAARPSTVLPDNTDPFLGDFWQPTEALDEYPWHGKDGTALRLPVEADPDRVRTMGVEVARRLGDEGITVETVRATVVPVRSFNRALAESSNKATATFGIIRKLIENLWDTSPAAADLLVRIDKQGGRDNYLPVLEGCIGGASFLPVVEGGEESRYVIEHGDRRMVVHFALRSDAAYLPVTLAGIVAKYSRELLMRQQNEWFSARQPGLGQTAGYPLDARRWLQDSLAVRKRLGVADALLIRNR